MHLLFPTLQRLLKKSFLCFFIICCWTCSDGDEYGQKSIKEYYYRNTQLIRARMEVMRKKFNGIGIEYFRNGKIKSKGLYVNNLREGQHEFYYDNGQLQVEQVYLYGRKHGHCLEFDEKGHLTMDAWYRDGQLDSTFTSFYKNGKIFQQFSFKEGLKNGVQKTFYENGQLKSVVRYKNGLAGTGLKGYTGDGKLIDQVVKLVPKEKKKNTREVNP